MLKEAKLLELFRKQNTEFCRDQLFGYAQTMLLAQEALLADLKNQPNQRLIKECV